MKKSELRLRGEGEVDYTWVRRAINNLDKKRTFQTIVQSAGKLQSLAT